MLRPRKIDDIVKYLLDAGSTLTIMLDASNTYSLSSATVDTTSFVSLELTLNGAKLDR